MAKVNYEYIEISNFCSYPKDKTRVTINDFDNLLIHGKNGDGKSIVVVEAMCYNLFGKVYRDKVNIGDLINNRNKKALYTKSGWKIGKNFYELERGQKPSLLKLYKNGEEELKGVSNTEFQNYINNLLGYDYSIFKQITILDSTFFKPYLSLEKSEKRTIVDSVFNLNMVTDLQNKSKEMRKKLKSELEKLDIKRTALKENLETIKQINEKLIKEHQEKNETKISELKISIVDNNKIISVYEKQIERCNKIIEHFTEQDKLIVKDEIDTKISKGKTLIECIEHQLKIDEDTKIVVDKKKLIDELNASKNNFNLKEIDDELVKYNNEKNELEKQIKENETNLSETKSDMTTTVNILKNDNNINESKIKYYKEHTQCGECTQNIAPEFAQQKIKEFQTKLDDNNKKLSELKEEWTTKSLNINNLIIIDNEKIEDIKNKTKELSDRKDKITYSIAEIEKKIYTETYDMQTAEKNITELKEKIIVPEIENHVSKLVDYKKRLEDLEKEKSEMFSKIQVIKDKQNRFVNLKNVIKTKIKSKQDIINNNEKEIESLNIKKDEPEIQDTSKTESDIKTINDKYDNVIKNLNVYVTFIELFGDNGVRKIVYKKNLPVLNKHIREYLELFEFNIPLRMNSDFDVDISDKTKGAGKYGLMSKGQRFGINMSILLSFLSFIEKQNSTNSNLLILDEADSLGFDNERKEIFFKVLNNYINKKVIAISHDESFKNFFDKSVQVKMINGFSRLFW